jgi:hypothetical protein
MTADTDTAATAAQSPSTPPSRRGAAANGSQPTDLHELQQAMEAMRAGDFSVRLPENWTGLSGKVADTFNEMVEMNERLVTSVFPKHARAIADELEAPTPVPARVTLAHAHHRHWPRVVCCGGTNGARTSPWRMSNWETPRLRLR